MFLMKNVVICPFLFFSEHDPKVKKHNEAPSDVKMAELILDEKCLVLKNRNFFLSNKKYSRLLSRTSGAICCK